MRREEARGRPGASVERSIGSASDQKSSSRGSSGKKIAARGGEEGAAVDRRKKKKKQQAADGGRRSSEGDEVMVARGTRRPSGGSREWQRWCVALEMVVVDGAAAGDGDGEDGWLGGAGWRTAAPAWPRRQPVVEKVG